MKYLCVHVYVCLCVHVCVCACVVLCLVCAERCPGRKSLRRRCSAESVATDSLEHTTPLHILSHTIPVPPTRHLPHLPSPALHNPSPTAHSLSHKRTHAQHLFPIQFSRAWEGWPTNQEFEDHLFTRVPLGLPLPGTVSVTWPPMDHTYVHPTKIAGGCLHNDARTHRQTNALARLSHMHAMGDTQ
jgi:hypothetical protein